jgi:hypothetical protein
MFIVHFSVSYGGSWGKKPRFGAYHVLGGTGILYRIQGLRSRVPYWDMGGNRDVVTGIAVRR